MQDEIAGVNLGVGADETVLSTIGLRKAYGSVVALDGVDLQLSRGAFTALLGSNGAGKSTLLQILTGLFNPDAGEVRVLGIDMARDPVKALAGLGVVFQQPALDLELTVEANLRYHADLFGIPAKRATERIGHLLRQFNLEERRKDRARQLSGGNRRRVELARALLHAPSLLLMDEATVGLDPASRADLLAGIRSMCERDGLSVLWTTHLLDEAAFADRILVLHEGRLIFDGTPTEFRRAGNTQSLEEALHTLTGMARKEPLPVPEI